MFYRTFAVVGNVPIWNNKNDNNNNKQEKNKKNQLY